VYCPAAGQALNYLTTLTVRCNSENRMQLVWNIMELAVLQVIVSTLKAQI
jgi:hypothetical protein